MKSITYDGKEYCIQKDENGKLLLLRKDVITRLDSSKATGGNSGSYHMEPTAKEEDDAANDASAFTGTDCSVGVGFRPTPQELSNLMRAKTMEQIADCSISNDQLAHATIKNVNAELEMTRKTEYEAKKAASAMHTVWEKELIKAARVTYKYDVDINSRGEFCRSVEIPGIATYKSRNVSNAVGFKMKIVRPYGLEEEESIYFVWATVNDKVVGFCIEEKAMCPVTFRRCLTKAGIRFCVANADLQAMSDLLMAKLLEVAEEIIIPYASGWHLFGGQWCWVAFDDRTYKEVLKEVGKCRSKML